MAVSSVLGEADRYTAVRENLFVAVAQGRCGFAREAIAAVVEFAAAAEVDVPAPYNAEPIPGLRLASCLPPFPQIPWESCMEESPHSRRFATCPVQFSFAPTVRLLVSSSLLLASSYPPQLWHEASSSSILPHLATAVEELATVPWAGLKVAGLLVEVAVLFVAMSWLPVEAGHDEVSTSAVRCAVTLISMPAVVVETCWWQV